MLRQPRRGIFSTPPRQDAGRRPPPPARRAARHAQRGARLRRCAASAAARAAGRCAARDGLYGACAELPAAALGTIRLGQHAGERRGRSASASSAGNANSGVPAKATRNFSTRAGRAAGRRRFGAAFLAFLVELLADALALEVRQVVDEQLALEVIHLVLDAHREHVRRSRVSLTWPGAVVRAQADARGTLDLVEDPRHRQAALLGLASPSRSRISGLISTRGSLRSFEMSMTIRRWWTSTWVAASPMPGAAYMVSSMSSIKVPSAHRTASRALRGCAAGDRDIRGWFVMPWSCLIWGRRPP